MIDTHCHILWGIDDASTKSSQSLDMLNLAISDNIKYICATSHNKPILFDNSYDDFVEAYNLCNQLIKDNNLDIKLIFSAENYLSSSTLNDLINDKFIPYGNTNYMLIEFAWTKNIHDNPTRLLDEVIKKGYIPLIAHPERYEVVFEDYSIVREWKKMGALMQVNRTSILALDKNPKANLFAKKMLDDNLVDFIGSDAHRAYAPRYPKLSDVKKYILDNYGEEIVQTIFVDNPKLLIK